MKGKTKKLEEIRVVGDQYTCWFLRADKRGRWRKFWFCGNTGVAMSVVTLLEKLGYTVQVEITETEEL